MKVMQIHLGKTFFVIVAIVVVAAFFALSLHFGAEKIVNIWQRSIWFYVRVVKFYAAENKMNRSTFIE